MTFTPVTVTANYFDPTTTGVLQIFLTHEMANGAQIEPVVEIIANIVNGVATFQLVANDDPGTSPTGVQYIVQEFIANFSQKVYKITVPAASAPATTLAALIGSTGSTTLDNLDGSFTFTPDSMLLDNLDGSFTYLGTGTDNLDGSFTLI